MKKKFIKKLRNSPWLFKLVSSVLRKLNPHYSYCSECGLPWNWCEPKSVDYSMHRGSFATCDYCWENCTLGELKQHYITLYKIQSISATNYGYKMDHTIEHLLECVEEEYFNTEWNFKDMHGKETT